MPIDPNISFQVNNDVLPQPLGLLGQVERLREEKNKNLLFQQQNDARMAAGEIYRNSLLPGGDFDYEKFVRDISSNPSTNIMAGQFIQEAQQRLKAQNELGMQNVQMLRTHLTLLSDGLGSLSLLGNDVTKADVFDVASRLVSSMPGDKKFYSNILRQIKDAPEGGAALQQWVQKQQLQMAPFKERMDVLYPAPPVVDTGGNITLPQTNRMSGTTRLTGTMEKTATPAERSALVPARNDEGAPIAIPRQNVAPMVTGSGRLEGPAAPGEPMRLGPTAEGQVELETAPKQLAARFDQLRSQISGAQTRMQEIAKMRDLLERAGTGKFAEVRTEIASILQTFGAGEDTVREVQGGADPRAVAAAQQFMKSAWTQAAASMKQMMPAGTQWTGQEVFTNAAANPNLNMDPQAARELFDFYTFQYDFLKAEQDFKTAWRQENPGKPLRQMDTDWTKFAETQGWVQPLKTGPGEPQAPIAAKLDRDARIPKDISLVELSMQPKGSRAPYTLDNGQTVMIRRGSGDKGNTYTLVTE